MQARPVAVVAAVPIHLPHTAACPAEHSRLCSLVPLARLHASTPACTSLTPACTWHDPLAGSLGYISFNDTFDLNIVIRTAAITPAPGEEAAGASEISIGAGGAIVVQSGAWCNAAELVGCCRAGRQPHLQHRWKHAPVSRCRCAHLAL